MRLPSFVLALFIFSLAYTQDLLPITNLWLPNGGSVYAIQPDTVNELLYLGGSFSSVGPKEPLGTVFRYSDHSIKFDTRNPNGTIFSAVPDEEGGWYLGGYFGKIGECQRNNIGHIDSLGRVTSMFLNQGVDGEIQKILKRDSLLFLAGNFTNVGSYRKNSGLLDPQTAELITDFPIIDGGITCIISDGEGGYYLSGSFFNVGDSARTGFAHLNSNLEVTSFTLPDGEQFDAMEVIGNVIFVGGNFQSIDDVSRQHLAAFDRTTGDLLSWAPEADGGVFGVKKISDTRLAVIGYFDEINGEVANSFAVIDMSGNLVQQWQTVNPNGFVRSVEVVNNTVYLGGEFTQVSSSTRNRIAAFNAVTGGLMSWNPNANDKVDIIYSYGNQLYVGGAFSTIGGQTRKRLAGFDLLTGALNGLNLQLGGTISGGEVTSIAVSGDTLYFAGPYGAANGEFDDGVRSVRLSTNTLTDWKPNIGVNSYSNTSQIRCIGNTPWYTGKNHVIGGMSTRSLAVFNLNTQSYLDIDFGMQYSGGGIIDAVLYGDTLIVGGGFNRIMGEDREKLAAIDLSEHELLPWYPTFENVSGFGNAVINALHLTDEQLIIGGVLNDVNGDTRHNAASFSLMDFSLSTWTPIIDDRVRCIRNFNDTIIIGGDFEYVNGQIQEGIAFLDGTSGATISSGLIVNSAVYDIELIDSNMYVAGSFNTINGLSHSPIFRYNVVTSELHNWNPVIHGFNVSELSLTQEDCYIAGSFSSIGGQTCNNFVTLDLNTGLPTSFTPNFSGTIRDMSLLGDTLYFTGYFQQVNGQPRNNAASINVANGSLTDWSATFDWPPYTIRAFQNKIYLGGMFEEVNSQSLEYLAVFDATTGQLASTQLQPNQAVYTIEDAENELYFGGGFSSIDGVPCDYIARYDLANGQVSSLNVLTDDVVADIHLVNDSLYLSGEFYEVNGEPHPKVVAYDMANDQLIHIPFYNPLYADIYHHHPLSNSLVVGGTGSGSSSSAQFTKPDFVPTGWDDQSSTPSVLAMEGSETEVYIGSSYKFSAYQLCENPVIHEIMSSMDTLCYGDQASVEVVDASLNGGTMWVWYANEVGGIPLDTGTTLSLVPDQTTTFFVRGERGCSIGAKAAKITVYVDPIPPTVEDCPQDTIVSHAVGVCSTVVNWDEPVASDNCSSATLVFQSHSSGFEFPQGMTLVEYDYQDDVGNVTSCHFTVTVLDSISAVFSIVEPSCYGVADGAVDITIYNGQPPLTIDWNNGVYSTEDLTNVVGGVYDLLVTDANGCIVEKEIILEQPDSIPTQLFVDLSTIYTEYDSPTAIYEWIDCNFDSLPLNIPYSQSYTATQNGSYAIYITDNGCSVYTECITLESVGTNEMDIIGKQLRLYPVPTKTQFNVDANFQIREIRIIGMDGASIKTINDNFNQIDVSTCSSGIYIVEVETGDSSLIRKRIVKE